MNTLNLNWQAKPHLPFTLGVELTALSRYHKEPESGSVYPVGDETMNQLQSVKNAINSNTTLGPLYDAEGRKIRRGAHVDGHCIEYPTPVFHSVKPLKKLYDTFWGFVGSYCVPQMRDVTVCGGNHLNFGMSNSMLIAATRDLAMRPYIPWVFTQPDDTDSCSSFLANRVYTTLLKRKMKECDLDGDAPTMNTYGHMPSTHENYYLLLSKLPVRRLVRVLNNRSVIPVGKCWSSTAHFERTPRLEIRCVEAPLNWDEMYDQLDFFIRYLLLIKHRLKLGQVGETDFIADLQKHRPQTAVKKFYNLLRQLELEPKRYQKYVDRNLYPRWELRRKRF